MDQAQMQELYLQYFYYILAAGIVIGLIVGAIPLILGIKRKKRNLGLIAFVGSGIIGGFSPMLAIIFAVIFIVLVLRSPRQTPVEVVVVNQEPIDVAVRDEQ